MKRPLATLLTLLLILGSIAPIVQPASFPAASAHAPPPPTPKAPALQPAALDEDAKPPHTPPSPDELPPEVEEARAREAIEAVLEKHLRYWGPRYQAMLPNVSVEGKWAYAVAEWQSEAKTLKEPVHVLAHRLPDGTWQALMPSAEGLYLQWVNALPESLMPRREKSDLRAQATELDALHQIQAMPVVPPAANAIPPTKEGPSGPTESIPSQVQPTATPTPEMGYRQQPYSLEDPPFSWAPDANILLFRQLNSAPSGPGGSPYDLWLFDAETGVAQLMVGGSNVWRTAFAVDGRVAQFWKDGVPYQTSMDPMISRRIATAKIPIKGEFSPDGSQLLYITSEGEVRFRQIESGEERALGTLPILAHSRALWPEWSPDGKWIAFLSSGQVYLLPASALSLHELQTTGEVVEPQGEASPDLHYLRWSADSALLFSYRGEVFTVRGSGDSQPHSPPPFSSDGRFAAYVKDGEVFVEDTTTRVIKQLTTNRLIILESQEANEVETRATTAAVADGFDFPVGKPNGDGYNHTAGWDFLDWTGDVYHPGEDWNKNCSGDCDLGDPIYAVANGTVIDSNYYSSAWGNIILVEHVLPDGSKIWSQYAHLRERLAGIGKEVGKGEQIGTIGKGANDIYWAHLHFEIRIRYRSASAWVSGWSQSQILQYYTDPSDYINSHRQIGGTCSAPSLKSPSDGYIHTSSDRTIPFSWSPPSDCTPDGYTFRVKTVSDMNSGGTTVFDEGQGGTQATKSFDSQWDNTDLYWSVRACKPCDPYTPGPWAPSRHFRIQPGDDPVRLWENENSGGRGLLFPRTDYGWWSLTESNFNDIASSIEIDPGWSARLWLDVDLQPSNCYKCLTSSDSNFSGDYFDGGCGVSLNDQASSIEVFHNTSCSIPCNPPSAPSLSSPSNGAKLYPEDNLVFSWSGNASEYQVHWWGGPGGDHYSSWMSSTSWNVGQQWESPNRYYWRVKGRNGSGCEGDWSSTWDFMIGPRAPSNLSTSAVSCSQINLSWQDNSSTESDYHIERSPNGSSWQQVATVSGTSYQDTGLNSNTAYYYRVRAHRHNDDTYSKYSNTASATTQSCPAPAPPTLVSPSSGAQLPYDADITLDWNSSSGATEYYAHLWGGPDIDINSDWSGSTDWHIGQLWPGIYQWQVKARNAEGESGWSTAWSFTVQSQGPDLIPFQGADWEYPVVPSSITGTHTVNTLYAGLPTYMDWGVINVGDTDIPGSFHVDLYFDDTRFTQYPFPSLGAWWLYAFNDWSETFLTSGWHTLRIVVDSENEVAESDETNNTWEYSFYWTCADPYESNDSWDTATAIAYGQQHGNGYICPAGDHDYFAFGGNTGDQIIVDIDAKVSGSALDSYLYLLDSDGQTVLAYNDDYSGSPDSHLEYALPHDGTFYLKVREYSDPNEGGPSYFYTLSLAGASLTAPFFDTMEWGLNDWAMTGFWHQVDLYGSPYPEVNSPTHSWWYGQDDTGDYDNGSHNSGELTSPAIYVPSSDYYLHFWHWYETETQGTAYDQRWIQISVNAGPFTNIVQLANDPMQTWLPASVIDLSPYAGQIIQLRFQFDSIDSMLNEYRGWYVDDFSISTDPPATCGDAHELNNTAGYATTLAYSQTITADICPPGDMDFYTFEGLTGDVVVVDVDAQVNGSLLDSYIYLLDSDGSTVLAQSDDSEGNLDSKLGYHLPHDGTYYVKVRAWNHPSVGSPDHFYTIHLLTDDTNPSSAEINSPGNDAWLDPMMQTITASATDDESGINRVEFLWHDADWDNPDWVWLGSDNYGDDGWNWHFDTSSLLEQRGGAFYIWAFDWVGNWTGAGVWNLGIDRTSPNVSAEIQQMFGDAPFRDFWVAWWNGSDNLSGIDNYDVQYRDGAEGTWTDLAIGPTDIYTRFVGLEDHTYYFRARALDNAGNQSAYAGGDGDVQHTVTTCPVPADEYEVDDTFADAAWITTDGISQSHNIHDESDQDWVKFDATAGITYTLATANIGGHADTVLELYDTDGSTLIGSNDDYPGMWPSSRLDWQPSSSGVYYARVDHWDPWAYGCTTGYGLSIMPLLSAPTLSSPPDGSTVPAGDVTFTWDSVEGATGYRIQIDTTDTFDSPALIDGWVTSTNYTATLSLGTWYWRVQSLPGGGFSSAWQVGAVEPVIQISTGESTDSDPALITTASGELVTIWERNGELWTSRSADSGATWSSEMQLMGCCHYHPAMVRSADDTLWLVFRLNDDIWYRTSTDGGAAWSPPVQVTDDPAYDSNPDIAEMADGSLWIVWGSGRNDHDGIWYTMSSDGGSSWSTPSEIPNDPSWQGDPSLAQASDGTVWVVWFRGYQLAYSTSVDNGSTWSPLAYLPGYPTSAPSAPWLKCFLGLTLGAKIGYDVRIL